MKLTLALSLTLSQIFVGDAFIIIGSQSISRTVASESKVERHYQTSSAIKRNSAFTLHTSTETPEDTSDANEKSKLLAEINDWAAAFEQVQETIQTNTRLYDEKMDDYEDDIEQLKTEIVKQITGIMSRDNDIRQLEEKITVAESQNLGERLDELEEEIRVLQNEIGILNEEMTKKDAMIDQMTNDRIYTNTKLKQNNIEMSKLSSSAIDEEKQSLSTRIQELKQEVSEQKKLEDLLSKYKFEVDSIQESLNSQTQHVHDKDEEIQHMRITIEALQSDLNKFKDDDSILQREIGDTKATLDKNEAQWKIERVDLMTENRNVLDLNKSLSEKLDEIETVQDEWHNEINALDKEKKDIFQEKVAIKLQLTNAERDAIQTESRLKRKIQDLEQKQSGFQEDTELRKEIVSVRAKSYEESMNVQLKNEQTERRNEDRIKDLECRVKDYQKERGSIRTLTGLCVNRIFRRERK
jgi:chromosome segregation ATPase